MDLTSFLESLKKFPFEEIRKQNPEHFEGVFLTSHSDELNAILSAFFGPPIKASGEKPSGEQKNMTDAYGGIMKNQTLYAASHEGQSYVAMIWPWSDNTKATVKVFKTNG